ncbi:MAG: hypothetical protein WCT03_23415 [Candidatus Obscuribacterales bacterium]|jgi:hypothetical protein
MINGLKQFTAAALIALSFPVSASAGEALAGSDYSNIIAVAPGIRNSTDSSIDQAVDYLNKADHAVEIKNRRSKTKPAFDGKVVKHRLPSNSDKILILGGSDIVPM